MDLIIWICMSLWLYTYFARFYNYNNVATSLPLTRKHELWYHRLTWITRYRLHETVLNLPQAVQLIISHFPVHTTWIQSSGIYVFIHGVKFLKLYVISSVCMKPCFNYRISITATKILHFCISTLRSLMCAIVRSYTREKRNDIFAREYMFASLLLNYEL